jgi:L-seryl-tRNA(Ser) seleniumtransferase
MRKHPLYRALRVSKLVYAALEATLESYLSDDAERSVPVLKMLGLKKEGLEIRIRDLDKRLHDALGNTGAMTTTIITGESVVGGGSAPDMRLETVLLAITHSTMSCAELERRLRKAETPVIVRIENDKVLIDLRTVQESEEARLTEILAVALG